MKKGIIIREYPSQEFLVANYDYKDGNLLAKKNRGKVKSGSPIGSYSESVGYYHAMICNIDYVLHRLIYIHQKGAIPEGLVVDHIDGKTKNNKIENLQLVTHQQNQSKMKRNNPKKRGLLKDNAAKKWKAFIHTDKGEIDLGIYSRKQDAIHAHDIAAIIHHGKNAQLNCYQIIIDRLNILG